MIRKKPLKQTMFKIGVNKNIHLELNSENHFPKIKTNKYEYQQTPIDHVRCYRIRH